MTVENAETVKALVDLGRQGSPAQEKPDGGFVLVVPTDARVHDIPPLEPKLTRVRQHVTLHDSDSFVSYVNRYKSEKTRLFAEPGFLASGGKARITAAIDYHLPDGPEHVVHLATYAPRYSEQWERWHKACEEPFRQAEFAEFIEETRADIREPSAAQLLDIVRTFKASKKAEFDSLTYQPNGSVKLVYDERVTQQTGSSGELPEQMTLGIPVYFRGTIYAVPVFVRYRVVQAAVVFQLKLDRADVIEDEAFGELTDAIAKATEIEVYLGRSG